MSSTDDWHKQITNPWDILHYADIADVLKFPHFREVRLPLCEQLEKLLLEYTEGDACTGDPGVRDKDRAVRNCVRRMRYFLQHLTDCGYWLVVRLSRDRIDLGSRVIAEYIVVVACHHRICMEESVESYRIYLPRPREHSQS